MIRSTTLFLIALVCVCDVSAQARWVPATSGPEAVGGRGRHDDVKFATAETGWLVNTRGQIWRTDDAGDHWNLQLDTGARYAFRALAVIDPRNVFTGTVQTPGSVLFATSDGGDTWTDVTNRISGTKPVGICGMSVVNSRVAYGVGAFHGSATVIKTSNGGQTWTGRSVQPAAATLIDVHFFDELTGIAVGGTSESLRGNAVVIRTTDGGQTWTRVYESDRRSGTDGEWGWKISFPTPETGYVSVEYASNSDGHPARVLRTDDAGVTWREIDVDGSVSRAGLQGIGFLDERTGWASGRGVTSITTDGGVTWSQLLDWAPEVRSSNDGTVTASPQGQLDGAVNRIIVVHDSLALAVGKRVYRWTGADAATAVVGTPVPEAFHLGEAYPNPSPGPVTLPFHLDQDADVRIEVIDALGRRWGPLLHERLPAGPHEFRWNPGTGTSAGAPAGLYFLLVDVGNSPEMKQVVLIR